LELAIRHAILSTHLLKQFAIKELDNGLSRGSNESAYRLV